MPLPSDARRNGGIGDLTSRGAAELTLTAFMAVDAALAIVAADGGIVLSNPAFDRAFGGFRADELPSLLHIGRSQDGPDRQISFANGRTWAMHVTPLQQGWLVHAVDVTDHVEDGAREAELARTDRLTGLGNRLLFCERLAELLSQSSAVRGDAAVLTIALDRFKMVIDTFGRGIGDALLGLISERIRSAAAAGDAVARLDGDEFAVIQLDCPQPESAVLLARRLVDLLGRPYLLQGQLIDVAAFVGITLVSDDDLDVDRTLNNADLALQRAKQERCAGYRVFESAMDASMKARRALEMDLRRAVALREFALVYQPQVNLQARRVTGFEALLRWNCRTRGVVSPYEFIPLAEETGIIGPIGEWVLRTACRDAAAWPGDYSVAVNISAMQFSNRALVATIVSALGESGLDPARLELEITESVMLDPRGNALAVLQKLRGLGVRVSLDDFGTGYSSLGYLRSFPFDKIKIDQGFVRGDADDRGNRAIVRAIASLGHDLGMATVAEGVETEDQLARVAADGCTDVQGYLISRPILPGAVECFLAESRVVIDAATIVSL